MNPERDEVPWRSDFVSAVTPNLVELERVDIFESRMFFLISHPIFGRIGRVERRGGLGNYEVSLPCREYLKTLRLSLCPQARSCPSPRAAERT
jgi:hypothetical protein